MGPARSRRCVDVAAVVQESEGLPPLARHVLLWLELGCEPTFKALAELTGASARSIRRVVSQSKGRLECHAGGPQCGQIGRAGENHRGQNGRARISSAAKMAAQGNAGNALGPHAIGACAKSVVGRATCNSVVKHKTDNKGVWGRTSGELLKQFPAILRAFPSVTPRILAERVALSATQSSRPGAYFATLMAGDATLSKKQRQSVEGIVDGLLKGITPAVSAEVNVSEVHACPRCASKRLQARGSTRAQCDDCGHTFPGELNRGKETGEIGRAHV